MKRSKFSRLTALISAFVLSIGSNASIVQADETMTFNYTGNVQTVTLEPGSYVFEVYGAKGGNGTTNGKTVINTGYGGYSKGELELQETTTFYIYVGGSGQNASPVTNSLALGGWNGGGNGGRDPHEDESGGAGGGASDIRLIGGAWNNDASLNSRIIVAGGASGATGFAMGRSGGATDSILNATQTSGFAFGIGANGFDSDDTAGSGAGGGYYGGNYPASSPGFDGNPSTPSWTEAGAGSSFISGHPGCNAILEDRTHTGQPIHYSGMFFTNTEMKSGVQNGHGLVRITSIFPDLYVLLDVTETTQLSVTHHLPDNIPLIWTSTNNDVVTVDGNGVATAVGLGTAYVWSESTDGTFKEYIPFRVIEGAEEMRLALHLKSGETKRLWYGYDPTAVIWESMDPSVATVDANGRITGHGKGLCIVKGTLDNVEKYIYVRVNEIDD